MPGSLHVIAAAAALALGAGVILLPKGTARHRRAGYGYGASLLLVNASALLVYNDSPEPGPFHALALVSLATLAAGFVPAVLRRPAAWTELHAYFLCWSYVGLVAAGAAQMAAMYSGLPAPVAVWGSSAMVTAVGGVLIHARLPLLLARLGSRPAQALPQASRIC